MAGRVNKLIRASPILRDVALVAHSGGNYVCPFCNYRARDLFAVGSDVAVLKERDVIGGGRRNVGCYKCGSEDRERLIYVYLKEKLGLFNGDKGLAVLHVAPEKNLSKKLLEFGFSDYVCGDLFTEGYRYPAHVRNLSILDIPFPDNYFDLIICNHVLEHIPDDLSAMRELNRVLKKGGQAILQVPISRNTRVTFEDFRIRGPQERKRVFGQSDHVRIYGQDYVDRLARSGFDVQRINISGEFSRFGLNRDEEIFVGRK